MCKQLVNIFVSETCFLDNTLCVWFKYNIYLLRPLSPPQLCRRIEAQPLLKVTLKDNLQQNLKHNRDQVELPAM